MAGEDAGLEGFGDSGREEFLYAIELARAQHDPTADWEGFRETLWSYLTRVFGIEDGVWPEGLPDPAQGPGGDARAVAAWLDETAAVQRSTARPGS